MRGLGLLGLGLISTGIALLDFTWRRRRGAHSHGF